MTQSAERERIADGLLRLIPERTKRVILASSDQPQTAGAIAKRAGDKSGAAIVEILRDGGFHQRLNLHGFNQSLWSLNDLGELVQRHLRPAHLEGKEG